MCLSSLSHRGVSHTLALALIFSLSLVFLSSNDPSLALRKQNSSAMTAWTAARTATISEQAVKDSNGEEDEGAAGLDGKR